MKREIKFRAWDLDEKVMIYPSLSHNEKYVLQLNCEYAGHFNGKTYDTVKLPLMEFIGRTDKHGKQVYEGDIFSHNNKQTVNNYIITYTDNFGFVAWQITKKFKERIKDGIPDSLYNGISPYLRFSEFYGMMKHCEVIGNIYETPEMLTF